MKNIKTILIVVAVVLGAVVALSLVGLILNLVQYVFWLGVIGAGGYVAVKLLMKRSNAPQIEAKSPVNELENADRTLDEYKRKYFSK